MTYEVQPIDRVYVDDKEVYDPVVSLDAGSQVKIMSARMESNRSELNIKDPSTANWKIKSLTQEKSDELLKVVENDAVYLDVNDAAMEALGNKQFAIERTENGVKTSWEFVINAGKTEVAVKNIDKKKIYAGQEKSFVYEVKGSGCNLTEANIKIYKANGEPADEANIKVKEVTASDITIAAMAVDAETDKATYYVDVVNENDKSLLKNEKKYVLNVDVLDSKFSAKNIEYLYSDEDNIYFKVKGLTADVESLYTAITVTAKAIVAQGSTFNALYKDESVVEETFKNDVIITVPVKDNTADERDDKSTIQDYSLSFSLIQKKTGESGVYKSEEVKLDGNYSNRALYYETKLKVKALPASKNVYTGQNNIQVATPIFSKESSSTKIIYLKDDKGQIGTNNYEEVEGNAYDSKSGKLVINIPAYVTPGKHTLTFEAYAPSGYIASKTSIVINVKIGIESIAINLPYHTYYVGNKDIVIKPKVCYYNETHHPIGSETITPTTCKATYSIDSENKELLNYITLNPANGQIKVSKKLAKVYDRIKFMGNSIVLTAYAADYPGNVESASNTIWLTTDGVSDYLKNNNEVRAFFKTGPNEERERTDVAIIDKNNKTKTEFTIKDANRLMFRVYRSASDRDLDYIEEITWKVSGPVAKNGYRIYDNNTLYFEDVKPGTYTVTATAADGSGKASVSRTFVVKPDSYKLGLFVDDENDEAIEPTSDRDKAFVNDSFATAPFLCYVKGIDDSNPANIKLISAEDMEKKYKVNIRGGVIDRYFAYGFSFTPTEEYTTITLINNNKGNDGKKVQADQEYIIHNVYLDSINVAFDKVSIPGIKVVANKYTSGKKQVKPKYELKGIPKDIVVDIGGGHTDYYLQLMDAGHISAENGIEKLLAAPEGPIRAEIMIEDGRYYAEYSQKVDADYGDWVEEGSDWIPGKYNIKAIITKGAFNEENIANESCYRSFNRRAYTTTLTIVPNNLKTAIWEGGKTTKIKIDGNAKDTEVHLVVSANSTDGDTNYFKWAKNTKVSEVRLTGLEYDVDTLNIFKEGLLSGDKLFTISSDGGNIDIIYKAEDFTALKNAVISAASGKSVMKGTSAQSAAAKMTAKPDKSGNYDMNKVKPVIRGCFIYEITGTDAAGYEVITDLTQNFEITLDSAN